MPAPIPDTVTTSAKIVIVGPFGVGKTTMIASVSEIPPLVTEERLTVASSEVDSLEGLPGKTTTTVGLDFGRITLGTVMLYMFGLPGQKRFWFTFDGIAEGSIGAVVLVDLRRLDLSFPALDLIEQKGLPFIVVVNDFPGTRRYTTEDVRTALDLSDGTVVARCDVRNRKSAVDALISVTRVAIDSFAAREVGVQ
jgi:signal recognition particle receptor subunit beta